MSADIGVPRHESPGGASGTNDVRRAQRRGKDWYSDSYAHAVERIHAAGDRLDLAFERSPLAERGPDGELLSMDALRIGRTDAKRLVVVSSGIHGVEAFFGSAVQLALLRSVVPDLGWDDDPAVLILHALNPYGFAWLRRVSENNVDLNRNFPTQRQAYAGCPEAYLKVDDLINPRSPPRWDLFYPRAAEKILRFGFEPLKHAVVGGQYERPQGLFFGGKSTEAVVDILDRELPRLIGSAEQVIHVDFHTGLGPWGDFKLLLDSEDAASNNCAWRQFESFFPSEQFVAINQEGFACTLIGSIGQWCRERFADRDYDTVGAEFGTYSKLKVLAALREENRAHHWGDPSDPKTRRAKRMMAEVFAPRDERWRDRVVDSGLTIVQRAILAMRTRTPHRGRGGRSP